MEYTLRLPVIAGDAIPLFIVADAMARSDATGRGTLALHGPTLRERRSTRNAQLVAASKNGTLIVCDSEGVATSAGALIHAARFPTDPLTVGPSGKVHQFTEIDALFVRSKHLNDWSQKDGDFFRVIDMPVQVVEFGPQDEHGVFAYRGFVGSGDEQAGTQPPAGTVEAAPVVDVPAWNLTQPKRFPGYAKPLYLLLQAAYIAKQSRPTAREVIDAFAKLRPIEIAQILPNGFDYYDAKGNTKDATLGAISESIRRMTA